MKVYKPSEVVFIEIPVVPNSNERNLIAAEILGDEPDFLELHALLGRLKVWFGHHETALQDFMFLGNDGVIYIVFVRDMKKGIMHSYGQLSLTSDDSRGVLSN